MLLSHIAFYKYFRGASECFALALLLTENTPLLCSAWLYALASYN